MTSCSCFCSDIQTHTLGFTIYSQFFIYLIQWGWNILLQCDRVRAHERAQRADVNWGISCQGIWIIAMGFSYSQTKKKYIWKSQRTGGTQETEREIVALVEPYSQQILSLYPWLATIQKEGRQAHFLEKQRRGKNHISNTSILGTNQPICNILPEQRPFLKNPRSDGNTWYTLIFNSNIGSFIDKKDPKIVLLCWCTELKMYLHFFGGICQMEVFSPAFSVWYDVHQ